MVILERFLQLKRVTCNGIVTLVERVPAVTPTSTLAKCLENTRWILPHPKKMEEHVNLQKILVVSNEISHKSVVE